MPATEFLLLYRDIRNSIDSIHDLAAATETDLRVGSCSPRAGKGEDLGGTIALLESRFQSVSALARLESPISKSSNLHEALLGNAGDCRQDQAA